MTATYSYLQIANPWVSASESSRPSCVTERSCLMLAN
jgi:hypothetical protein